MSFFLSDCGTGTYGYQLDEVRISTEDGELVAVVEADGSHWRYAVPYVFDAPGEYHVRAFGTIDYFGGHGTEPLRVPGRDLTVRGAPVVSYSYDDGFSSASSGWSEGKDQYLVYGLQDGSYVIGVRKEDWREHCWAPPKLFRLDDFTMAVDVVLTAGSRGYGAVIWGSGLDNYYALEVDVEGRYRLSWQRNGEREPDLVNWTQHSAIRMSPASNQLEVTVRGNSVILVANDVVLETVVANAIDEGRIGLCVGTFSGDDPFCEAHFDDLSIQPAPRNSPPEAGFVWQVIGGLVVEPYAGDRILFDSSQSSDPDGEIVEHAWDWNGDGTYNETSEEPLANHVFNEAGTYAVNLRVTDNEGNADSISHMIVVFEVNNPPTARFTWQAESSDGSRLVIEPREGDTVQFDASDSSDPDGEIVEYAWDWDSDGTFDLTSKTPTVEHPFASSGSHRVTLRVTDDDGATGEVTKTIAIIERQPPEAAFSFSPARPSILDDVAFTDTSPGADWEIVSWMWLFGDGDTSTNQHPTHRYAEKGTFTVRLTVTDNDGMTDTATQPLTVINLPPNALFSFAPEEVVAGQPVAFDGSGSRDPDGEIVSCTWDFDGDGTTDVEGDTATWSFSQEDEYIVELTVTDNDGTSDSTERQIVVAGPGTPTEFDEVWAVVVGIGDYRDEEIDDLDYTEPDAEAFYDFLVRPDRGGFPIDHVRMLLGEEATANEMRDAFTWLADRAGEEDLVVFYFSGHGTFAPDRNGDEDDGRDEYLVPWDTEAGRIEATAVCDDEIGYWLSNLRSQHVLLVLDSCFSGGATRGARSFSQGGMKAGPGNRVFTDLIGAGRLFLAASQESETALEDPQLGHGVFTYFLLKGLGGLEEADGADADSNGDGRVTVRELKEYLVREVARYSRQTPQVIGDEKLLDAPLTGHQQPPIVDFSWEPEIPTVGWSIGFVNDSTDDGEIVAYEWDFGDGYTSIEQSPAHAYAEEGVYTVTLTVTDDAGLEAVETLKLSVGPLGQVTAIAGDTIIISLGSANGVRVGDRFAVIRTLELANGQTIEERKATIEVTEVVNADRSASRVVELQQPIEPGDVIRSEG